MAFARGSGQNAGIQTLESGHDGILMSPQRGVKLFQFVPIEIQRSRGLDLAIVEIHFEHDGSGKSQLHNFFEEDGKDLFGAFGGKQTQGGGITRPVLHRRVWFFQYARAGHRSHSFSSLA